MRKSFFRYLFLLLFSSLILFIFISTFGIETTRFNNFISQNRSQNNNDINLKFTTIKFKLDVKDISLFLKQLILKLNIEIFYFL